MLFSHCGTGALDLRLEQVADHPSIRIKKTATQPAVDGTLTAGGDGKVYEEYGSVAH